MSVHPKYTSWNLGSYNLKLEENLKFNLVDNGKKEQWQMYWKWLNHRANGVKFGTGRYC